MQESKLQELKLVEPSVLYKESFLEFVEDVKSMGYESYQLYIKAEIDFEEFVSDLINTSKGINLLEGWVPCQGII